MKNLTKKKVIDNLENWFGDMARHLRSFVDGSSRAMVYEGLWKVETPVSGIPPGTVSFLYLKIPRNEDAGMDFLNHQRFRCSQNVQRDGGHVR